jgi:hypothetical protein
MCNPTSICTILKKRSRSWVHLHWYVHPQKRTISSANSIKRYSYPVKFHEEMNTETFEATRFSTRSPCSQQHACDVFLSMCLFRPNLPGSSFSLPISYLKRLTLVPIDQALARRPLQQTFSCKTRILAHYFPASELPATSLWSTSFWRRHGRQSVKPERCSRRIEVLTVVAGIFFSF